VIHLAHPSGSDQGDDLVRTDSTRHVQRHVAHPSSQAAGRLYCPKGPNTLAGLVGGGLKYDLSSRWGIRVERACVSERQSGTHKSGRDAIVALGQLPAGRVTLNADPTIQFGNSTNPVTALGVTAVTPSTLSDAAIERFRTWSGSGITSHTNLAVGMYWRS
jgi:hypothetical protein